MIVTDWEQAKAAIIEQRGEQLAADIERLLCEHDLIEPRPERPGYVEPLTRSVFDPWDRLAAPSCTGAIDPTKIMAELSEVRGRLAAVELVLKRADRYLRDAPDAEIGPENMKVLCQLTLRLVRR